MSTIDQAPDAGSQDDGRNDRQAAANRERRRFARTMLLHMVLVGLSFTFVLPFLWMILTSLKPLAEVGTGSWLPSSCKWGNYAEVFRVIPFARFY